MKVVTRFAPSPTGFMHVGGVRTALYAWAWAKKNHGIFILRIEDTDKSREVKGSVDHIIESLKWLGITWDEGPDIGGPHAPYFQSERLESYKKYAKQLIDKGYAYPDPYTEEEVAAMREKAEAEKRPFLYREHRPKTFDVWDGSKPLRFKVPEIKSYTWNDAVRGELSAGPEALDDFVLIKTDGYPTYNFAHIIDDLEMGVTHIMRADEFIASMPKFLSLYEALAIIPPIFVTLPPILGGEGKKKLGKRDGSRDILEYRKEGYLPEALVNYLALLGWKGETEQEIFSTEQFIQAFSIDRIHKAGAMFDEEKLAWINKEHIRRQPKEEQLQSIISYMKDYPDPLLDRLLTSIIDRISSYGELSSLEPHEFHFFIQRPQIDPKTLPWKGENPAQTKMHLLAVHEILKHANFSSPERIKEAVMPYAEIHGRGNVLWPFRIALSGQEKSIDPFTISYVLEKDEVLARIEAVCHMLPS